jgi:transposase-like protein
MRELSVAEQRYQAVLAVIGDGRTVSEVAGQWRVSRQTLHSWLARYEASGLQGLVDRSHRPALCPHQIDPGVEALTLELRRSRPYWGPRRLARELDRDAGCVGDPHLLELVSQPDPHFRNRLT